jgi:hypothetical protein
MNEEYVTIINVRAQCNLVGNTDVSEEAIHLICKVYDASSMFPWRFCTHLQEYTVSYLIRQFKTPCFVFEGRSCRRETNKQFASTEYSFKLPYSQKKIFLVLLQFFPYPRWLENKRFLFSVQFLSNLQYPPLISHTVSTQLSTDGWTTIHTIVPIGIGRRFYNQISRL